MRPLYSIAFLLLLGCSTAQTTGPVSITDDPVEITILQLNDVYEIAPLEGGKVGGLARVATLLRRLERENPNTIAVMAGDFLSPSFVGTLKMDGERVAGKQMIETLNVMGLDYATFGNHEFDLSDSSALLRRLDLADFSFISSNARWESPEGRRPFRQKGVDVPDYAVHEFRGADGRAFRLALVGVVLPFARQDYLHYDDVTTSFRRSVKEARGAAELVLGLTHLNVYEDEQLARDVGGLPLFMGGHEHENLSRFVGSTAILKADANAKTVYVHHLKYYPATGVTDLRSELVPITPELPEDPPTKAVVDRWLGVQNKLLDEMGYVADRPLAALSVPLEGKESVVRNRQTNYGTLTLEAFRRAWAGADVYLLNSGSLRVDDNLSGTVTEYDVLRSFPFGGPIVSQTLKGRDLIKLLDVGTKVNKGAGGYLQILGPNLDESGGWVLNGTSISPDEDFTIVLPKFLAQGKEANLDFLGNFSITERDRLDRNTENDIRSIVIAHLAQL